MPSAVAALTESLPLCMLCLPLAVPRDWAPRLAEGALKMAVHHYQPTQPAMTDLQHCLLLLPSDCRLPAWQRRHARQHSSLRWPLV